MSWLLLTLVHMCIFELQFCSDMCPGVGLLDHMVISFLRNLHTVSNSGCTNVHAHWQYKRVPFSPHPPQHLLFADFLVMVVLTDVRWYPMAVLMCTSPIISDTEHLFMCLSAFCMSSLEKGLFRSSNRFFNWICLLSSCVGSILFWKLSPYQPHHLQIFSPILLSLFVFIVSFAMQKLVSLIWSHLLISISLTLGD